MSEDNPHSLNGSSKKSWFEKLGQLFKEGPENLDDLKEVISHARSTALVDDDTEQMLIGVLDVSKLRVRDIMIPRSQMVTIDISDSYEEVITKVVEGEHSRFPVISEDKDHVEGIIHAKELLAYSHSHKDSEFDFQKILRKAVVVPESKRIDTLLKSFRSERYHMAIVVDEYGGVSGLVTIEDILELIVGDIEDEFDGTGCESIRQLSKQAYLVEGLTPIEVFNQAFGTQFPDTDFDTIGGMIAQSFGHMPNRGEKIELDGVQFKVTQADTRRLKQLQVKLPNRTTEQVSSD